jgi:DNA-binding GntR family transcriptional regulator
MNALPSAEIIATKPQYVLVAQTLIDDIRRGQYEVGALLPSEFVLCTQFGVSRHTVREAMRLLIERGLVTRQRGIGTTVTSREQRAHYTQSTASVGDLPQYVEETRLVTKEVKDVLALGELSELLACPAGQRWLYARGFRYVGRSKDPIALTHIYINAAYAGIKGLIRAPNVPVYTLIERQYGERVAEVKQRIDAKVISADEAKALKVASGSAGLVITRHYYAVSGRLLEVAVNLHPAERFSYSMSLRPAPL